MWVEGNYLSAIDLNFMLLLVISIFVTLHLLWKKVIYSPIIFCSEHFNYNLNPLANLLLNLPRYLR